jgi:hypothetical protein
VVCDRALEEAFRLRTRKIDVPIINAAARALAMPEQPVASAPTTTPQQPATTPQQLAAKPAADSSDFDLPPPIIAARPRPISAPRAVDQPARPAPPPRLERLPRAERASVAFGSMVRHEEPSSNRKWLLFGVLGVVAIVAIWFLMSSRSPAPSSSAEPAASQPAGTPPAPTTVPPPPANVAPPTEPATPAAAIPPASTSPAPTNPPPTAGAASGSERFEIIVASFRTDARASQVASEVTALGLPIRRRVSDGWQQVLAGPFASRSEASAAQQRLNDAGLTGTQIVPLP